MRLTESDIAAITIRELTNARGYDSDILSARRAAALNYYNGKMTAPAAGGSAVVSLDVADAVHATLAQVMPVVKTSQIEFEAQSQQDEIKAQSESDFVRVTIERASGYDVLSDAVHDALLVGNGWLSAYVDESVTVVELSLIHI